MGIISMLWMYLTPMFYSVEMVPEELVGVFYLNPMTSITIAYRDILYYGKIPEVNTLINAAILGVVVLMIGKVMFSGLQRGFAEEL